MGCAMCFAGPDVIPFMLNVLFNGHMDHVDVGFSYGLWSFLNNGWGLGLV